MKDKINFVFQDWKANQKNTKGKLFSLFFRTASLSKENKIAFFLLIPFRLIYKVFFEWIIGIEIPHTTIIGEGLIVYHLHSITINEKVKIGKNCVLRQVTTIGNKIDNGSCPVIGDNVNIGAHTCIIGDILIGNNVIIGAGSIVINDIPSNSVVAGNPAKIIRHLSKSPDLAKI